MDFLQTKFRVPPIRRESIERPRLIDQLDRSLETRLTLISAPAGFGKTTLVAEWLRGLNQPFAWVSLDSDDNAWPRFLASCLTGLQGLHPDFGTGLLGALETTPRPTLPGALTALSEELASLQESVVLVLDDFHVLTDPQVHDLLARLIETLPPEMHLVLSGRADPPWPMARLRAAGSLAEIRAGDLRFTRDETAALLNDKLGLDLSAEDLASLEGRTEGWVAGLHLAALSLRHAPDRHGFIQAFAGSDRFVLDYLMEEVLAQQPPEVESFLLKTSLLDRFNAGLCDHVTRRDDGESMLRRLESANLFVIPLDNERLWFSYHALMGSFLRAVQKQRDPEAAATAHGRASEWYEARGDILDAIQYGLRAGAHDQVVRLIRSNALALVFQGDLPTVITWLHDSDERWPGAGPWLRIAQLWGHAFSGDEAGTVADEVAESRDLIHEGLHAFADGSNPGKVAELEHALAHLLAIEAHLAVMDGRHEQAAQRARAAITALPSTDSTTRRYTYVCLGMALRQMGELEDAVEALAQADAPAGDRDRIPAPARGLGTLAGIQIWMGQLDEAEATCRRLLALHDDHLRRVGRRPPIAAFGFARLSEIFRQRNQRHEALHFAQQSRFLADRWQQLDALYEAYTSLAAALDALGDRTAALTLLHTLEQAVRGRSPWLHTLTLVHEAQLCLAHAHDPDCLDRARAWAEAHPLPADRRPVFQDHALYLAHARLLLKEAQARRDRAQAGLELSRSVVQLLEPTGARGLSMEATLLCAQFEAVLGDPTGAVEHVLDCLREAEPQGYVRLFLDQGPDINLLLARVSAADPCHAYAQSLLQAAATASEPDALPRRGNHPPLREPLSERETEVLRLLATALSSAEIADELCVATSTVRSHTKSIYGKLGVHTRLEAIDLARELGLI